MYYYALLQSMPSVPVHSSPAITNDVYPETGPAIMTMIAMTTVMKRIVITMVRRQKFI